MLDMPYFMENEEWYRFDFDKRRYVLTEKAPPEARESYEQYYRDRAQLIKDTSDVDDAQGRFIKEFVFKRERQRVKSGCVCDDRKNIPEDLKKIRYMSDEEFEEHLRKLREENMDD